MVFGKLINANMKKLLNTSIKIILPVFSTVEASV